MHLLDSWIIVKQMSLLFLEIVLDRLYAACQILQLVQDNIPHCVHSVTVLRQALVSIIIHWKDVQRAQHAEASRQQGPGRPICVI